jgi:hypothetical protein
MGRGNTGLESYEYDEYLSRNRKERELRERKDARRLANKGFGGWHFGIDDKPVYTKDKDEFRRELHKRGLMMKDDVKRNLK